MSCLTGGIARHLYCWWCHISVPFDHILGPNTVRRMNPKHPSYLYPHHSTWSFYVPLFGTLINLGVLYWKRHSHPLNFVLLSTFTLMEAFTLGVVVAFYDNVIVIQALWAQVPPYVYLIFICSKPQTYHAWCIHRPDFVHSPIKGSRDCLNTMQHPTHRLHSMISQEWVPSCLAVLLPWVRQSPHTSNPADIWYIVMAGLVNIFIPFSKTMDLVFAIGGCFLFSGYIVYDTYMINAKLSPDEFIMGAISLYLECVNWAQAILWCLLTIRHSFQLY